MITVAPSTAEHARAIAAKLSGATLQEIESMGMTPLEAVMHSFINSAVVDTAFLDGEPIAMWGAVNGSLLNNNALLWFIDTPDVQLHAKKEILQMSKYFVGWCEQHYTVLECMIDSRHHQALRLVKWLGFRPTGHDMTVQNVQFVTLEKRKK